MRVDECMSRDVATCRIHDGLGYARRVMHLRRVGALVVVDEAGRAEGVVTRGDVEIARLAPDWRELRVWDVMGAPVRACEPAEDALAARRRLQAEDIGRMPVIDARGRLCGIVSRSDLARAAGAREGGAATAAAPRERAQSLPERREAPAASRAKRA